MKILNIGLPRTGTYSLCIALRSINISCVHYPFSIKNIHNYSAACEVIFDYESLEKEFPNSLYIYTKRDLNSWMISCNKHKKNYKPNWNPFWLSSDYEAEYYKKEESLKFFNNKKNRLLIFNVFKNDGWNKLCGFLEKEVPNFSYPHLNRSKNFKFL